MILNDFKFKIIFRIWKEMALNDSLTIFEKSKLAVWEYPVSDKFTKVVLIDKVGINGFQFKLKSIKSDCLGNHLIPPPTTHHPH